MIELHKPKQYRDTAITEKEKKKKIRRGEKVKHREKRLSESLCSAVSRTASKIQIRSQRERCALRCAKTALLNLPPGWFPPPLSFPPLRLPSCARSISPHKACHSSVLLLRRHTPVLSLPPPAFVRTHALSYLRSLADEISPPAPPPSEFFPRLS